MFAGEKKLMVDEFYPIYSQVLKDKDQGVYEDFIECLKLYDKAEDGHMIGGELTHILLSLGKRDVRRVFRRHGAQRDSIPGLHGRDVQKNKRPVLPLSKTDYRFRHDNQT